jgi:hypothetical protein
MEYLLTNYDLGCILYALTTFVCLYGWGLFGYWWVKCRFHASAVFLYVMWLFFTIGLEAGISCYARMMRVAGDRVEYDEFTLSTVWQLKLLPLLFVLLFIVIHMTARLVRKPSLKDK